MNKNGVGTLFIQASRMLTSPKSLRVSAAAAIKALPVQFWQTAS